MIIVSGIKKNVFTLMIENYLQIFIYTQKLKREKTSNGWEEERGQGGRTALGSREEQEETR